jgi:hypothetical protein
MHDEADLALPVLAHGQVRVADQLAVALDREHHAGLPRLREMRLQHRAHLVLVARFPVEPARNVVARVDGVHRGDVVERERAQSQAGSVDHTLML